MTSATGASHPAPHRHRVSGAALGFALLGGPLAWIVHQVLNYVLAVYPCFPDDEARTSPLPGWGADRLGVMAVDVVAVLVAMAAAWVAWRSFQAVRNEHPGGHQALLEKGEGRTRFLALFGLLSALGFAAAVIFDTVSSLMAPLCAA